MLEVATISTIYPFLMYAFGNESGFTAIPFIDFDDIFSRLDGSLVYISAVYVSLILMSLFFRIFVLRKTGKYIALASNTLTTEIFEQTAFSGRGGKSSQEVVSNILLRCNYTMGALVNLSNIFAALVLIGGVVYTLISVNPTVTLIGSGSVIVCYLMISGFTNKKSYINGQTIDKESVSQLKYAYECFSNFKNIVIEGRVKNAVKSFQGVDARIRLSRLSNHLINSVPRLIVETLIVFSIIGFVSYSSMNGVNITSILPLIGLYALAFQKILPSINSLFVNYSNILQAADSIEKLAKQVITLRQESDIEHRKFDVKQVEVSGVANHDLKSNRSLHKPVSKKIQKGEKIIIKGRSGIGKSTFLESLIGLRKCSVGELKVNGELITSENLKMWWNSLTYIPQTPFIYEASLVYNISQCSHLKEVDQEKYEIACKTAHLSFGHDIQSHLAIMVQEDGRNLSGGEKQRLVIARALYRSKDVIFMDEALSALDPELRRNILNEIFENYPNTIILYVSHNEDDVSLFKNQITLTAP